jgi:hypothetical protein
MRRENISLASSMEPLLRRGNARICNLDRDCRAWADGRTGGDQIRQESAAIVLGAPRRAALGRLVRRGDLKLYRSNGLPCPVATIVSHRLLTAFTGKT